MSAALGFDAGFDSSANVRTPYGVPAKTGMRIRIHYQVKVTHGKPPTTGVIRGADHHLIVLLDGEKEPRRLHPTWLIDYLDEHGRVIASYGDD